MQTANTEKYTHISERTNGGSRYITALQKKSHGRFNIAELGIMRLHYGKFSATVGGVDGFRNRILHRLKTQLRRMIVCSDSK